MTQLAEVSKLSRKGLNVRRAVGVAVAMLLAGLLQKRTAKAAPPAPVHEGQAGEQLRVGGAP
jgi:hypothetical protein